MNKRVAELRAGLTKPAAPDTNASLSRRLKAMERNMATVAKMGGGFGTAEVEHLVEDVRQMVAPARALEEARPPRPFMNDRALEAHMRLFDAAGAIEGAMRDLREKIQESDVDPTGSILASVQVGRSLLRKAEEILAGGLPS